MGIVTDDALLFACEGNVGVVRGSSPVRKGMVMDEKHSNSKAFQTHIPHFPDSPRRKHRY